MGKKNGNYTFGYFPVCVGRLFFCEESDRRFTQKAYIQLTKTTQTDGTIMVRKGNDTEYRKRETIMHFI